MIPFGALIPQSDVTVTAFFLQISLCTLVLGCPSREWELTQRIHYFLVPLPGYYIKTANYYYFFLNGYD
jgi:hypothetical protein